jgi:FkbM family methyltransferase
MTDTLGSPSGMADLTQVRGMWVLASDAQRFETFHVVEGLPNADIIKMREASSHCVRKRVALDVGAHVGITATYLARSFEKVVAFEAVPITFTALERNAALSPNIAPINCAIGRAPATMRFEYVPSHGQLSHALLDGEAPKFENSIITDPVPMRTIDSFEIQDVDFIKIDVEGYEGPVVEGARETILRCRPIIVMEQRGNEKLMHGDNAVLHEASLFVESLGMTQLPTVSFHKDRLYHFAA